MTKIMRRYFGPYSTNDDGTSTSPEWIDDQWRQLLVDFDDGRVRACISDDGYGKYDVHVYISLPRMLALKRRTYARLCSLRPFPLCTVQLWDTKSLDAAYRSVEAALGRAL